MIKLSKTSKMPGKSWSLQAGDTCPGSIDPITKTVIAVCSACYAKDGLYNTKESKQLREDNRRDWRRDDWVNDMIRAIKKQEYFRWFDSGDLYHPALAEKILNVMQATPNVKHWLPTKSYRIPKIRAVLDKMKLLPNVAVRFSSPNIDGTYDNEHGSTVIPHADSPTTARVCGAYSREGKCGDCRNCWDKSINVIAYPSHGIRMKAKIRRMEQNV